MDLLQDNGKALGGRKRKRNEEPEEAMELPTPQRIDKLDAGISWSGPRQRRKEKADILARVRQHGVRRLESLVCSEDPAWALDLLRSAAPTLEELHVGHIREEHLLAVHAMPRLQRLNLECYDDFLDARPPVLPALPRASLYKWLRVCNAPRPTLESLLQAHSAALDVLWLQAGTPDDGYGHFPSSFNDMDALLDHCGVRAARVFLWRSQAKHDLADCAVQVSAVRRVLPAATVQCCNCDEVPYEEF